MAATHHVRQVRVCRTAALWLAAVAILFLVASPAFAGRQKVTGGAATLTVLPARVAALTGAGILLVDAAPLSFRYVWDDALSWSYRAPMAAGGSFDAAAREGTLVLRGGLRFVNVSSGADLLLSGLRVVVDGPSHVLVQAAVGGPPVTRADVLVSTSGARVEKKGKRFSIGGLQFRPTPQLVIALQTALVGTIDASAVLAAGDLTFRLK